MIEPEQSKPQILLLYDGECPFCQRYTRLLRLRASLGDLQLVDARQESNLRQRASDQGYDLDQGFVLQLGEQLYFGEAALNRLALMSSRSDWFNRLNFWLFRSPLLSRIAYPILRSFRNLALWMLRKPKINNKNQT